MYFLALKPPSIPYPLPISTIPSNPIKIKLKNYQSRVKNPTSGKYRSLASYISGVNPPFDDPLGVELLLTENLASRQKNPVFPTSLQSRRRPDTTKSINPDPTRLPVCGFAVDESLVKTLKTSDRVRLLASEFSSLPEPIDRVRRLLHYAAILPPFDDSGRVEGNRVMGCTAQVWLECRMDSEGSMRFRVDSDSEIAKGFCSCLIWLLDGAEPDEVLSVGEDDLAGMNIGMHSTARSRVNTWHNVLISMKSRTRECVLERERLRSFEGFEIPSIRG